MFLLYVFFYCRNILNGSLQWLLLQTKISHLVRCSSKCSELSKSSSQRPQCCFTERLSPKWICKVCGSFAMKSHSLHWNFTMWYVCSCFLCSLNFFSLSRTFSHTSQAAGKVKKSTFECAFVLWIFKPRLEVVVYSHLLHLIVFSSETIILVNGIWKYYGILQYLEIEIWQKK